MTSNIENEFFINKFKNRRLDSLLVDKKLVTSRKEAVSLIMTCLLYTSDAADES